MIPLSRTELIQELRSTDEKRMIKGIETILKKTEREKPEFSHTWIERETPSKAELVDSYNIRKAKINLFRLKEKTEDLYQIIPSEYEMDEYKIKILSEIKKDLKDNISLETKVEDLDEIRDFVKNESLPLFQGALKEHEENEEKSSTELLEKGKELSEILAKYTAGYGLLETLLLDEHVEDVYVDAPAENNYVYVEIESLKDIRRKCRTNVRLTSEDLESLTSRFRIESGEPFSEAYPVLETDLPEYNTRVTAIRPPLTDRGTALAIRRRSQTVWTLPRLIKAGSLTPLAAGLLSFLIDGRSTFLVGGSRGAGKTTLLGAMMMEFPRSQRILTIEDTKELPIEKMQTVGYNIQNILTGSGEYQGKMEPDEVLRVSLRLGESAIVMGEVRGEEAKTLYEAMRAGTAGSAVMGTIHGNSSKGIYDRVVHDIGISKESFSATDIVLIAGIVRPGGAQEHERKVIQLSEYSDEEFNDLMRFEGDLTPTDHLKRNSKKIGKIARSWGLSYNEAIENIKLRARLREEMVNASKELDKEELLGPEWVAKTNSKFWHLISKYKDERDYGRIESEWKDWFEKRVAYA